MADEQTEAEVVGDGKERVAGKQRDGTPPLKELARIVVIGVPVMIIAWYFVQWMHGR